MSTNDYIINSLQIANVCINNFSEHPDCLIYNISTTPTHQVCPCCGKHTSRIHDYRSQTIKDLPVHHKKVIVILKKRRYVCLNCGKKFYEPISCLSKYKRYFNRVKQSIWVDLHSTKPMKEIAKNNGVSPFVVQDCLNKTIPTKHYPNNTLGIDEFKGDANGERFQVILTDPENKKIVDVLPDRNKSHLSDYFKDFPNKNNIKYITMDMYRPYYDLARLHFPNATIVIDRFHFIRQIVWAVENVRKKIQKHLCKEDRLYFKHSKKLLLKAPNKLTIDEKNAIYVMFSYNEELREIYEIKNWFYEILSNRDLEKTKKELHNWIEAAKDTNIHELKDCIRAYTNWFNEICNGIILPYNNAFTEGKNNKTKVLKRYSYGIKKIENLQKRILLMNENIPILHT